MLRLRTRSAAMAAVALSLAGGALAASPAYAATPTVHVWATGVNVRVGTLASWNSCNTTPSTGLCSVVRTTVNPGNYTFVCQQSGQTVTASGYSSNWWTWINVNGTAGWVSNVFLTGPAHLTNVPNCTKG